jgi:CDP-diacylglycerol--glycerol-3-phosphate 3-phosphatidyltransferase
MNIQSAAGGGVRGSDLATSLTSLKPRLKKPLRPRAVYLARSGVTANPGDGHVLVVGALLCVFAAESDLFAIPPAWLAARTAYATIDGMLAIEFGPPGK